MRQREITCIISMKALIFFPFISNFRRHNYSREHTYLWTPSIVSYHMHKYFTHKMSFTHKWVHFQQNYTASMVQLKCHLTPVCRWLAQDPGMVVTVPTKMEVGSQYSFTHLGWTYKQLWYSSATAQLQSKTRLSSTRVLLTSFLQVNS